MNVRGWVWASSVVVMIARLLKKMENKRRLREARVRLKCSQRKRAARSCAGHEAEDEDKDALGVDQLPGHVKASAADAFAKKWFRPVFGMVDVRSRWPVTSEHIEQVMAPFLSPTQALKNSVLTFLQSVGRSRAAQSLRTRWHASRAALAFISSRLGDGNTAEMPCPSFDEGYDLAVKNLQELVPPCWAAHPGICEKLHKDVLADAMDTAKKLQTKLVSALQDEPAKFWVFDCLSSHCRKTIVVWMIGWTQLSTAPRSVFLTMQAQQDGTRAGPFTTRQVEIVESDCKLPILERRQAEPLPHELHLQFATRKGPRLGLLEPVWVTQFGLGVGLVLEQLPVSLWKCYSAEAVRWGVNGKVCLGRLQEQPLFLEQRPAMCAAVVSREDQLEAMQDDDVLDQDALSVFFARRAAFRRQAQAQPAPKANGEKEEDLLQSLQGNKMARKKGGAWKHMVSDSDDDSSEPVSEISSDSSDCVRAVVRRKAAGKTRKAAANLAAKSRKRRVGGDGGAAPGPAEPAPVPAAPAAVLPPAVAVPPPPRLQLMDGLRGYMHVQIQDLGIIVWNESNINAHCAKHYIPGISKCHCDRVRRAADCQRRAGQGRPLGLLMLWLKQGEANPGEHSSRAHKIRLGGAAFQAERAAARAALRALPGTSPLFDAERALRDGEDDEPLVVPG